MPLPPPRPRRTRQTQPTPPGGPARLRTILGHLCAFLAAMFFALAMAALGPHRW